MEAKQTKVILNLIQDEIEAIRGYKEAITAFCDNKEVADKLTEIMKDESEHSKELSAILLNL